MNKADFKIHMNIVDFKISDDKLYAIHKDTPIKDKGTKLHTDSNLLKYLGANTSSSDLKINVKVSVSDKSGNEVEKDLRIRIKDLAKAVGLSKPETKKLIENYKTSVQKGKTDIATLEKQLKLDLNTAAVRNFERSQTSYNMNRLFNEAPSSEKLQQANILVDEIKNKKIDLNSIKVNSSLTAGRTGGSTTLTAQNDAAIRASERWESMNNFIFEMAHNKKSITLNDICHINATLNSEGGKGDDLSGEYEAGSLRSKGENISAGQIGSNRCYLKGEDVELYMKDLVNFINDEIKLINKGQSNPVLVGAQVLQRMLSIHPFHDANGRTSRLVMDYVLLRSGLPPPSPGNDVKVAVFGLLSNEEQDVNPDKLLDKAMNWMNNTVLDIGNI